MIQAGWIFLQTEYFPEDWLSPNSIEWLQCPIPEKEIKYWQPKNLSIKERKKLAKTLSRLYYGIEVHDKIYAVEDRLIHYLSEQDSVCSNDQNLRTRDWLLKILDILTVILLDFCKGMTKPEGIGYPQLSNTKQEVNIQDAGNESEKL